MKPELTNRIVRPSDVSNRAEARDGDRMLSAEDLAREWRVHVNTVYRDIRKGALRALRLPGGRFRIRREDADRYGRPTE